MPRLRNMHALPRLITAVLLITLVFISSAHTSRAGTLTQRSDRISTSAPGVGASHHIRFTTTSLIPASGTITITPEASAFAIPGAIDYQDTDVQVNSTQQTLAATPGTGSGSALGVSVTTGTSGSVTITLNDTDTITGGSVVEIDIGTETSFGGIGDNNIINPGSVGSYRLVFTTRTSGNSLIDSGEVGVAIVNPVGISGNAGIVGQADAPQFSPAAGSFVDSVDVSMSSTTGSSSIYYTTDGSTPTTSNTLYTGPITITTTTTVKAIATAPSYTDSTVTSGTYTIVPSTPPPPPPPPPSGGGGGGSYTPPSSTPYVTPIPTTGCDQIPADLNCDTKVNAKDLSILMYYWNQRVTNVRADINKDGIVNLIDFSVMLYWWRE